jgi:hypothetical protein
MNAVFRTQTALALTVAGVTTSVVGTNDCTTDGHHPDHGDGHRMQLLAAPSAAGIQPPWLGIPPADFLCESPQDAFPMPSPESSSSIPHPKSSTPGRCGSTPFSQSDRDDGA